MNRETPDQVSLSIKTMPDDADPYAIRIAQHLAENLRAVGIDTKVVPIRTDEFYRGILINQDFDLYAGPHPGIADPDGLFSLLHSSFNTEVGWQNPFGFDDPEIDKLLSKQRSQTGARRRRTAYELQRSIATKQPFTVVAIPDTISTIRATEFDSLSGSYLQSPLDYLVLSNRVDADGDPATGSPTPDGPSNLRVTYGRRWISRNLNPLAVEYRGQGTVTGLLYDPLIRWPDNPVPWLAKRVEWNEPHNTEDSLATVQLRNGCRWHDGQSVTTEDVAFTYQFLTDTSTESDRRIPAPRFRGRVSLVDSVEPIGDNRLRFRFGTQNRTLALRSLTVPILPRHEWEPRASQEQLVDLDGAYATEALVWSNMDPVGGGPLRFNRVVTDDSLVLDRFDDHFTQRETVAALPRRYAQGFGVDRVTFRIVPSDHAGIQLIASGEADVPGTNLNASVVPEIVRSNELRLLLGRNRSFYHVGYNSRRRPLSNPRFRRAVARLIDKEAMIRDGFRGYATPATTPLTMTNWLPPDLEWIGEDPVLPFVGANNNLDLEEAKSAFSRAGFSYSEDGELVGVNRGE